MLSAWLEIPGLFRPGQSFFAIPQFADIRVKASSVATIRWFQGKEPDLDRVADGEKTESDAK
jgi:hypothetical protein